MKLKALAVIATVMLLPALASAAPPSKTPAVAPLAWYDANGKLVGRNTSPADMTYPWLAMAWGDDLVPVQLEESPLALGGAEFHLSGDGGSVYFSLPNCTGTAYLSDSVIPHLGYRRVAKIIIQQGGSILHVSLRNPTLVQRTTSSYTNGFSDCDNVVPGLVSVFDIEGSLNLSSEFTLPLYLK